MLPVPFIHTQLKHLAGGVKSGGWIWKTLNRENVLDVVREYEPAPCMGPRSAGAVAQVGEKMNSAWGHHGTSHPVNFYMFGSLLGTMGFIKQVPGMTSTKMRIFVALGNYSTPEKRDNTKIINSGVVKIAECNFPHSIKYPVKVMTGKTLHLVASMA